MVLLVSPREHGIELGVHVQPKWSSLATVLLLYDLLSYNIKVDPLTAYPMKSRLNP